MENSILVRILALKTASLPELQKEYAALYDGKKAPSNNKTYLWQRIAYRIQELEYGGIPDGVYSKVSKLVEEFDPINNATLRPEIANKQLITRDRRLPIPGTLITKNYKGTEIRVKVLEKGFEYNGKFYRTLTAVAKAVSGIHWGGYSFFNM
jgi:hypothetical protein